MKYTDTHTHTQRFLAAGKLFLDWNVKSFLNLKISKGILFCYLRAELHYVGIVQKTAGSLVRISDQALRSEESSNNITDHRSEGAVGGGRSQKPGETEETP